MGDHPGPNEERYVLFVNWAFLANLANIVMKMENVKNTHVEIQILIVNQVNTV